MFSAQLLDCVFLLVMVEAVSALDCITLYLSSWVVGGGLPLVPLLLPGEGFKSVIIEPRTGIWQPEGSSGGILLLFTLFFFRLLSKKRGRASRLALRWFQQWKWKKRASKIVTSPRFKISNAMSPIEAAEHKIEIDRKRSQLEWWRRVKEVLRWGVLWEVRLIC